MKRFLLTLALSVLTALSVCALEAKVISVSGQVEQQRGASWIAVKTGDVLQKGAVISTGFNSEATLNINGTVRHLQQLIHNRRCIYADSRAGFQFQQPVALKLLIDLFLFFFQYHRHLDVDPVRELEIVLRLHTDADILDPLSDLLFCALS